jgi:hypothetical protein
MKYRVIEYESYSGKRRYKLQFRAFKFFWYEDWMDSYGGSYDTLEEACEACDRLGSKDIFRVVYP